MNSSECFAGVDSNCSRACWQWKRDTSSDEVTGHFAVLLIAYKLLAQSDAERDRIARLLCDTAAYIQDGGYVFVDPVSGKGTSWGYWDPAQLNGVPGKPDERGENSLELLGYMGAAARVCDATGISSPAGRFGKAFAELVTEHGYDVNAVRRASASQGWP